MSYNIEFLSNRLTTAGKITILSAVIGVAVFLFALVFDFGAQEISKVVAQNATTTLTVLNTPPAFLVNATEVTPSSTTTPTNSGTQIVWSAVGQDPSNNDYYLLICSSNATPTARVGLPPTCSPTSTTQWAVSPISSSSATATAATTTTESLPFTEENIWYAWVCDAVTVNPRCNITPVQGITPGAPASSPFNVNRRPTFTGLSNNSPRDPGSQLVFNSTSSDNDVVPGEDAIILVVCQTNSFSSSTRNCTDPADLIASTTVQQFVNASATRTLAAILQDDVYPAYGFIIDEHGHTALGNGIQADFIINNVAPTISSISLNSGGPIILSTVNGQTTGFPLTFTAADANSCINVASTTEVTDYVLSVYRNNVASSTCTGAAGGYNANNCYPSEVAASVWNLSCTASTTSCLSSLDDTQEWSCTFPLWHIADPTDSATNTPAAFAADTWVARVAGIDDNNATGTFSTSTHVDLVSFPAFALDSLSNTIPYGALEPGQDTGTLRASTTILAVGNTGLDNLLDGTPMCDVSVLIANAYDCPVSSTSTIPVYEQQFSSSSVAYDDLDAVPLSSTTTREVETDVPKSTSTSSPSSGQIFFGIEVPSDITVAGSYTGLNTFLLRIAEPVNW